MPLYSRVFLLPEFGESRRVRHDVPSNGIYWLKMGDDTTRSICESFVGWWRALHAVQDERLMSSSHSDSFTTSIDNHESHVVVDDFIYARTFYHVRVWCRRYTLTKNFCDRSELGREMVFSLIRPSKTDTTCADAASASHICQETGVLPVGYRGHRTKCRSE